MGKSCTWLLVVAGFLFLGLAVSRGAGSDGPTAVEVQVDANRLAQIAPQMQQFVSQKQISGAVTLVA